MRHHPDNDTPIAKNMESFPITRAGGTRRARRLLRESVYLHARYRYTKHLLEGEYPDDRNMYREMKGLFIDGVLEGYRQALAEIKGSEQE